MGLLSPGKLQAKKPPEFLDRIYNPDKYPYIDNGDGTISTHKMAAETDGNGKWFVFPTIQFDGQKLVAYDSNEEAMQNALATGNFLEMPSKEDAISYAQGGYKENSPLLDFNPLIKAKRKR